MPTLSTDYLPPTTPLTAPKLTLADVLPKPVQPLATLPALFVSHGAPSLAIERNATTQALAKIGQNLPTPRLIVMLSAHWQSSQLELNANPLPPTWHDFSGFGQALAAIDYPAHGYPEAAYALAEQLQARQVAVSLNRLRAYDHGVWAPLVHVYPNAEIPVLTLSLPRHFDSYACYQLGALFAPLRAEQVLLIGSGSVTHNLSQVRFADDSQINPNAWAFRQWLVEQLRYDMPRALYWQAHPLAMYNHASPEHLLPLFFAAGAGQRMSVVHERFAHYSLAMDIYRFD